MGMRAQGDADSSGPGVADRGAFFEGLARLSQRRWCALSVVVAVGIFYADWLTGRRYIWEDLLYHFYPAVVFLTSALRDLRMPLWDAGLRCGMPFLSEVQAGVIYPPNWILGLINWGERLPWLVYQWYLVAHVLLAGAGMYLFLGELRLAPAARSAGAITFCFSGFMAMRIIHAPLLQAAAWIPMAMFFVRRAVGAGRRTPLVGAWVALLMSFLAGCPQITLYGSMMVVVYWWFIGRGLWDTAGSSRLAGMREVCLQIVGVFGLVVLAGSMMVLPTIVDWSSSGRARYDFAQIADTSMPWWHLTTAVFPNFFGVVSGDGSGVPFWGVNRDSIEFRVWGIGPWYYWELAGYSGQVAFVGLIAALVGWRRWIGRPEMRFFAVWAIFCLWFMLGRYGGLFQVLYHVVPGMSMFRVPARMSLGLHFAGAVIVAQIVDMALCGEAVPWLRKYFRVAFFGCGILLVVLLVAGGSIVEALKQPVNWENACSEVGRAMAINGLLFLWLWDVGSGGRTFRSGLRVALPVIVTFADLYLAYSHFHRGRQNPDEYYADRMGIVPRIREMRRTEGPFRFAQMREGLLSEEVVFPRNMADIYPDLEVPEGYVTFNPRRIAEFQSMRNVAAKLDIMNVRLLANAQGGRLALTMNTNALPRARVYHAREEFASWPELLAALEEGRLDYRKRLGLIQGESGDVSGILAGGPEVPEPVSIERVTPERMRLRTRMAAPGAIFVSQTYYSGWRARDAGGRDLRVVPGFGALTAILVPSAGETDIAFEYRPRELGYGMALSLVGLGGGVVLWGVLRRRERLVGTENRGTP